MVARLGIGLGGSWLLLAVGEIPDAGVLGQYAQLGAVGILAAVCWRLFATIDKLSERWDKWETQRHEDQLAINETLTALRENCAAVKGLVSKKDGLK